MLLKKVMVTYKELQALSFDDIKEKLKIEINSLKKLKLAHSVTPIENPLRIRQMKKTIARLKMIQSTQEKKLRVN